jgi:ATP-binding cassette subfamily B protein
MAGQRLRYGGAILAMALATLGAAAVPIICRDAIDSAITPAVADSAHRTPNTGLWRYAAAMIAVTAAAGFFTYLKGRWSAHACESIARNLRNSLYDHLQRLPMRYLDKADTGDLVQRCTSDVESLRMFLAVQVVEIGNAALLLATVLPLMLRLDSVMTLISLSLVPAIVGFAVIFFIKVKQRFREVEAAEAAMTTVVQENLTGIRVVRAFARQEFERAKFARPNGEYRDKSFRLVRLMAIYWTASDFLVLAQMGLTLGAGAYFITQSQTTVGTLYAFLAYLQMMLWPVRQMGRILTDLGKAVVALGRMTEILNEAEEEKALAPLRPREGLGEGRAQKVGGAETHAPTLNTSPEQPTPDPSMQGKAIDPTASDRRRPGSLDAVFTGAVAIRGLAFTHAGAAKPALSDINLDIAAGETVALLGPSGAGKSTLMHLLLRLYDFDEGVIAFDGLDIRTLPRQQVRRQIGVVMQEPFLFSKTLGDNIRHGRSDAMQREIEAAAQIANIHETIVSFDQGYATILGERGVNLSGGQRQRVAIARAIVRDPAILILDDALSAVDSHTETLILDALRQRRGKRTTLIIAHRLSTLMQADQIVVLDQGRIIQRGTHASLQQVEGLYRRLWQIQSSVELDLQKDLQEA